MIGVGSVVTKNWWMWMVPQVANPHLSSVSRCSTIQIVLNYISSGSIFRGDSLKESLELLNLMMLWWIYFGCIKKLIIENFGGSEEDLKGLFYWENYCNMGVRNAETKVFAYMFGNIEIFCCYFCSYSNNVERYQWFVQHIASSIFLPVSI